MTRSQLRSTIRWESVIIALQGTVLGLVIGVFFGWALVRALHDEGIDRFRIPFVSLAVVVVLAALAGVVAAILPSRRAARLDVLQAIVHGVKGEPWKGPDVTSGHPRAHRPVRRSGHLGVRACWVDLTTHLQPEVERRHLEFEHRLALRSADAEPKLSVSDGLVPGVPVERRFPLARPRSEGGTTVGHVVVNSVALDGDDGADPASVGSCPGGRGPIVRRM